MPRPVGRPVDSPPEDFRRWYLHPDTTAEARAFARGQIFEWDRAIAEREGDDPPPPRKPRTKTDPLLCGKKFTTSDGKARTCARILNHEGDHYDEVGEAQQPLDPKEPA